MKLADRIILHLMKYGRKDPSDIMIPNFYHGAYEMDVFKLMKTGYVVEYEVKISRADFFNDFKKMRERYKYDELYNLEIDKTFKHDSIRDGKGPNRFFFVVPDGLIKKEEVPAHCGLMYFTPEGTMIPGGYLSSRDSTEVIKPAPLIHKGEYQDFKALATSLSWREDRWRRKFYKNDKA